MKTVEKSPPRSTTLGKRILDKKEKAKDAARQERPVGNCVVYIQLSSKQCWGVKRDLFPDWEVGTGPKTHTILAPRKEFFRRPQGYRAQHFMWTVKEQKTQANRGVAV